MAALVVYLQHWHFVPEARLVELMHEVFGVGLSAATLAAMAQRKAEEWTGWAAHIGEKVKQAPVKHLDETGLRIAGVLQWLHVASTWLLTFYHTSRHRGAMRDGVLGIVVHDFWRPYFTLEGSNTRYATPTTCGNQSSERQCKSLWRGPVVLLRHACHAANRARRRNEPLKPTFLAWWSVRYDRSLAQGLAFHESQPPLETLAHKRRGRTRRRTGITCCYDYKPTRPRSRPTNPESRSRTIRLSATCA